VRVIIDVNVVVSAVIRPGGPPSLVVDAAIDGRFDLVASPQLIAELRGVLGREKFRPYISAVEATDLVHRLADSPT
jgi:putative PIN family toxin of toxin-antitoxin system